MEKLSSPATGKGPQTGSPATSTSTALMAHIATLESDGSGSDPTTWLEPVDEAEYQLANQAVADQR